MGMEDEVKLLILYASQTGNALDAAERLGREAERRGCPVTVLSTDEFDASSLPNEKLVVLVVSTTGQGDAPDSMKMFWRKLLQRNLTQHWLEGVRYAVFGLGDSGYQKYNFVAKKLDKRLSDLGATAIIERGLGDDQHPSGAYIAKAAECLDLLLVPYRVDISLLYAFPAARIEGGRSLIRRRICVRKVWDADMLGTRPTTYEGALDPWMSSLWNMVYEQNPKLFPKGPDFVIPDMKLMDQPKIQIMYHEADKVVSQFSNVTDLKSLEMQIERARSMSHGKLSHDKNRPGCFLKMTKNYPLTIAGSEKDVRHFEFEPRSSIIEYEVGDVLEILPGQSPAAIDAFMQRCASICMGNYGEFAADSRLIGILLPWFLNLEWMAKRRRQPVMWIRCFTCRRFSSSRKNCMGVVLGGTSRMILLRNSTVCSAIIVVDLAELTQRFSPDYRKWAIAYCTNESRMMYLFIEVARRASATGGGGGKSLASQVAYFAGRIEIADFQGWQVGCGWEKCQPSLIWLVEDIIHGTLRSDRQGRTTERHLSLEIPQFVEDMDEGHVVEVVILGCGAPMEKRRLGSNVVVPCGGAPLDEDQPNIHMVVPMAGWNHVPTTGFMEVISKQLDNALWN
ncbi:hypothetical protein Acr_05g0004370 [Actinidia rufa]|uniref:Flavodoxin-like domain-containing protein n=1 Tax=Actinidia rufa TaxID=165716 RepID=A0A7J0EK05_9ERIC|nr:hypothetical protein Acr_05g0004370 [Actinidia rufa]